MIRQPRAFSLQYGERTAQGPSDPVTSLAPHRSWRRTARGAAPLVAPHRSWRRTARGAAPLVAPHRSSIQFYSTGARGQGPPVADCAQPGRARQPGHRPPGAPSRAALRAFEPLSKRPRSPEFFRRSAPPSPPDRRGGKSGFRLFPPHPV